jgi:hypothetical protein
MVWSSPSACAFAFVEAMVGETGNVRLLEPLYLSSAHKALAITLDNTRPLVRRETANAESDKPPSRATRLHEEWDTGIVSAGAKMLIMPVEK